MTDQKTERPLNVGKVTHYLEAGCAYVGFTGATGGLNAEQDILNWKFTGSKNTPTNTVNGTAGNDTITLKRNADGTHDDVWINAPVSGPPTQQVLIGLLVALNGGGGNDTLVLDSSNGNPLPTGGNAVLRLNSGSGTFTLSGSLPTLDSSHLIDLGKSTLNVPHTAALLPAVQSALKSGFIKSTDAAASNGKFAIADVDNGSQVTLSYRIIGDLNGDGTVAFADLLTMAQNYNKTGKDWSTGDLTYDGTVNFNDLLALAQHYNQSAAAAPAAAAATPLSAQTLASVAGTTTKKPASKLAVRATARG